MRIFTFVVAIIFWALSLASTVPSAWTVKASTRADTRPPEPGPLKPGRTAGVKVAQQARTGLALIGTGAIIAVVVVAAGSSGQSNMQIAPATTTSP